MKAACLALLLLLLLPAAGAAEAGLILTSPYSDYTVGPGEEAVLSIGVVNGHGHDVTGTLSVFRTLEPEGSTSPARDSRSYALGIWRDVPEIKVRAGSMENPGLFLVRLSFSYDDEDGNHAVTLDGIRVHVVKDPEEKPAIESPLESTESVRPTGEPASGGTQGSSSADSGTPGESRLNDETSSLKSEIAAHEEATAAEREALTARAEDDPLMRSLSSALAERGYNPAGTSAKPAANGTGEVSTNFRSAAGEATATFALSPGNVSAVSLRSFSEETLPEVLLRNETFIRYRSELRTGGYSLRETRQNYTPGTIRADLSYSDSSGRDAAIRAAVTDGAVAWIVKEMEPDPGPLTGTVILAAILLAALGGVVLIRRRKVPALVEVREEKVPDYREEAERILREAMILFENGDSKAGYAGVAQAFRHVISCRYGTGTLISNGEALAFCPGSVGPVHHPGYLFDRCSLVAFAGVAPNREEFTVLVSRVRGAIREVPGENCQDRPVRRE